MVDLDFELIDPSIGALKFCLFIGNIISGQPLEVRKSIGEVRGWDDNACTLSELCALCLLVDIDHECVVCSNIVGLRVGTASSVS